MDEQALYIESVVESAVKQLGVRYGHVAADTVKQRLTMLILNSTRIKVISDYVKQVDYCVKIGEHLIYEYAKSN